MQEKSKVLLIYPMGSYVDMPTLGIPCLLSSAKSAGFNHVDVWDANLDFLEFLLSVPLLSQVDQKLRSFKAKDEKEFETCEKFKTMWPTLIENLAFSKNVFHDEKYYFDTHTFNRAFKNIFHLLDAHHLVSEHILYHFSENGFYSKPKDGLVDRSIVQNVRFVQDKLNWPELDAFLKQFTLKLKSKTYDLVGISCTNYDQFVASLYLSKWLKANGLAKQTVLGGNFPASHKKAFFKEKSFFEIFDYMVYSEGEDSFVELLKCLEGQSSIEQVPNLLYFQNNEIVKNPFSSVKDLNKLTTPDFSCFDLKRYWTPHVSLPHYSSRGCFYDRCKFCNHHANYGKNFRVRKPSLVSEDLKIYQEQYQCKAVFFVDEVMSPKHMLELSKQNIEKSVNIGWYAHSRVEPSIQTDDWLTMGKGGLTLVHVGMESANTKVLKLMDKGYTHEDTAIFLKRLMQSPVSAHINTIRGYPGELPEDYMETLETVYFNSKLGDCIHLYGFSLIRDAILELEGSPHLNIHPIPSHLDLQDDMTYDLTYDRNPSKEQDQHINLLRSKMDKNNQFYGLFPQEFRWVVHLLYIQHYRETKQTQLIDTPMSLAKFKPFDSKKTYQFIKYDHIEIVKIMSDTYVFDKLNFNLIKIPLTLIKDNRIVSQFKPENLLDPNEKQAFYCLLREGSLQ